MGGFSLVRPETTPNFGARRNIHSMVLFLRGECFFKVPIWRPSVCRIIWASKAVGCHLSLLKAGKSAPDKPNVLSGTPSGDVEIIGGNYAIGQLAIRQLVGNCQWALLVVFEQCYSSTSILELFRQALVGSLDWFGYEHLLLVEGMTGIFSLEPPDHNGGECQNLRKWSGFGSGSAHSGGPWPFFFRFLPQEENATMLPLPTESLPT